MTNVTDIKSTGTPVLRRDDAAADWALSDERIPVFKTVRTVPNPNLGMPRTDLDIEPGSEAPIDERETIDEVVEYTMPAKPNPGLALAYLKHARENADLAASWLLEKALGTEGYDTLAEELADEPDPDKAQATMQGIIVFVAKRALGGLGKA